MHPQTVHPLAPESGQQRGMDVEHAVFEVRWNEHVLEKSAHHDVLHICCSAGVKDSFAESLLARCLLFLDDDRWNSGIRRELQTCCRRVARNYEAYFDGERSGLSPFN